MEGDVLGRGLEKPGHGGLRESDRSFGKAASDASAAVLKPS
jgi:hypothetical protein